MPSRPRCTAADALQMADPYLARLWAASADLYELTGRLDDAMRPDRARRAVRGAAGLGARAGHTAGTGRGPALPTQPRPNDSARSPAIAAPLPHCNRCARTSRSNTATAAPPISLPSVRSISSSGICCCAARVDGPPRKPPATHSRAARHRRAAQGERACRIISAIPVSPVFERKQRPIEIDRAGEQRSSTRFRCPTGSKYSSVSPEKAAVHDRRSPEASPAAGGASGFRALLEKRTTNEYLVPARQLYDQIIRPLEPLLSRSACRHAGHCPRRGAAHRPVCRAARRPGTSIDRYATAVAPSLNLVEPKSLAASTRHGAGPRDLAEPRRGYVDLPNVPQRGSPRCMPIEGGKFCSTTPSPRSRFADRLKDAAVQHRAHRLAWSVWRRSDQDLPARLRRPADDRRRSKSDIKYSTERARTPSNFSILSACETATGDDRAALGLAGVALKAGARSALATLWYINDDGFR